MTADHGPFETENQAGATPAVRAVYAAFDANPGVGRMAPHNLAMLTSACEAAGVGLGAYDRRQLGWLASWDPTTCAVVAGLIRRAYLAGLAAEGERLGYVVVTWPQTGGQPDIDAPGLYLDRETAEDERDSRRAATAAAWRRERHEIAEVTEMEDGE